MRVDDTRLADIALGVYDARNGAMLGTYQTGQIPANGQKIVSAATLEAGSSPSFQPFEIDMAHYTVRPLGGAFQGSLQHIVHNESADTIADLTAVCQLTP